MMDQHFSRRNQEISLPPSYWNALSQDDRTEFVRLRSHFLQGQKISSKDRRIVTFRKELIAVLKYIERSDSCVEERSVLVGVCFAGPFICVNTRQLKNFLGRCKSSINGSFQQMGYVALRTKAKARSCVLAVMPSLQNDTNILRQWTVRCASEDASFCFLSSFSHVSLPQINEEDLYDEKRPTSISQTQTVTFPNLIAPRPYFMNPPNPMNSHKHIPPNQPRQIHFDLPSLEDDGSGIRQSDMTSSFSVDSFEPDLSRAQEMISSYSVEYFQTLNNDSWDSPIIDTPSYEWETKPSKQIIRSNSANFQPREWTPFDDFN